MIYRVHKYDEADGSFGYEFFTSKRAALACLRAYRKDSPAPTRSDDTDIDHTPTPRTQAAVLDLLRWWGEHPNNG